MRMDEKILYTLFNIIDSDNKFILVTSKTYIDINFGLADLNLEQNFSCKNKTR